MTILSGGHLGFMQITGIAQGCHSGNQAKLSLGTHVTMILSKNNTLLTATRSTIRHIRVATGLLWSFPSSLVLILSVSVHFLNQSCRLLVKCSLMHMLVHSGNKYLPRNIMPVMSKGTYLASIKGNLWKI